MKNMIICAAVKVDGTIYRGNRHPDAIMTALRQEAYKQGIPFEEASRRLRVSDQGFMTSENKFVDRAEGYAIAEAAGQLRTDMNPDDIAQRTRTQRLTSEDLY